MCFFASAARVTVKDLKASKTPKTTFPKTPARGKTPRTVKKSIKKRTYADMAKKTPAAAKAKGMVANIKREERRLSGRALPKFRMVSFHDLLGSLGHVINFP